MAGSVLEGYYSKAELAAELEVTERTLDRYNTLRIGPTRTRVGRQIFYAKDAVREWLAQGGAAGRRSVA